MVNGLLLLTWLLSLVMVHLLGHHSLGGQAILWVGHLIVLSLMRGRGHLVLRLLLGLHHHVLWLLALRLHVLLLIMLLR